MKVKVKTVRALLVLAAGLFAGSASAALTHTAATIDTRADVLKEALPEGTPVALETDDDGQLIIVLSADIPGGLTLPADLGPVTIDLNGWSIKGRDGDNGSGSTAGENGGAAVTVDGTCGAADEGATTITVIDERSGVQLWENGPFFAECNIGAKSPDESGYYFWWGDTNGYVKAGSKWTNARTGEVGFRFIGENCPTYGKNEQFLRDGNWIDANGNLTPEHDAATAYLGAEWRMPTSSELTTLINCDKEWTNDWNGTGVAGYVVSGNGKSIFFPAAGYVDDTTVRTTENDYWTATRQSGDVSGTNILRFYQGYFNSGNRARMYGATVRAVRNSDSTRPPSGTGPAEIIGGDGGDGNPAGKGAPAIAYADGTELVPTVIGDNVTLIHGIDGKELRESGPQTLWITDHADAGSEKVHLAFQPIFAKPVDMAVWIPDAYKNGLIHYVAADTEAEFANAKLKNDFTLRGGTGTQDVEKGWCWITVPSTNKLYKIVINSSPEEDGVQLWKDGPFFAECNIGATKPEDAGYRFWWGDTVGYTQNVSKTGWVSVEDGKTTINFNSQDTVSKNVYQKGPTTLFNSGITDANNSDGKLKPEYDAATKYLGAKWRLPTYNELQGLVDNCNTAWTNNWNGTGMNGRVVTGKGEYASKSVFFPAAGYVKSDYLLDEKVTGCYWSSSQSVDNSYRNSRFLYLNNDVFKAATGTSGEGSDAGRRTRGYLVRPVRDAAE